MAVTRWMEREAIASALIALMPLCIYLGRAIFYCHFFLLALLTVVFFHRQIPHYRFSSLMTAVSTYFAAIFLINIIPSEFSFLNDSPTIIVIFLMIVTIFLMAEFLFFQSAEAEKNIEVSIRFIFISLVICSAIVVIGFMLKINILHSIKYGHVVRYVHDYYHSSQNLIAVGTGFMVYRVARERNLLNVLLLLIFFLGNILSYGRTAIVVCFFSLVVYLLISLKSSSVRLICLAIFSLTALLLVSYISSGDMLAFSRIHTSERLDGAVKYIDYVVQHSPWTGLGVGGARFLREKQIISYGSPHNLILEAFVSQGVTGLAVLLFFLGYLGFLIRKLYHQGQDRRVKALLVTVPLACLLDGQAYLSLWSKHNMLLIFFYLALVVSMAEATSRNPQYFRKAVDECS